MKTTEQWWDDVASDPDKMIEWLKKQYHGEQTAAIRILLMLDYKPTEENTLLIKRIVADELKHAEWVKILLTDRGVEATVLDKEERYWDETIPKALEVDSFSYMCAVAYLAEAMRLDRITLLSSDDRFKDIAEVFTKIRPDEANHVKWFESMTTPADIAIARKYHNLGMNAIGLLP